MSDSEYFPSGEKCHECGREIMCYNAFAPIGVRPFIAKKSCLCVEERRGKVIEKGRPIVREHMLDASGLSAKRYRGYTFADCITDKNNRAAVEAAQRFLEAYQDGTVSHGLLFHGPVGSGKSFPAYAIGNAIVESYPISDSLAEQYGKNSYYSTNGPTAVPVPLRIYNAVGLMDKIREGFDTLDLEKKEYFASLVSRCQRTPLLILDDLCAEKESQWTNERFYSIFHYRWERELPTIVTTNATPRDLFTRLYDRTADRIKSDCKAIYVPGSSRRKTA